MSPVCEKGLTVSSCYVLLSRMFMAPALESHRTTLMHLTEMTSGVLRVAYARTLAAEGAAFYAAVEAFSDLGRGVRLSIALDLRLMAFARVADQPVRQGAGTVERAEPATRPEPVERERERDVERDSFPMDPLGRVCALERIITRTPALDPDRKVSAEIIEIKAFLEGSGPTPPEPHGPVTEQPTPTFIRPPNRAERRRMRHASG